jgi:hypothetical protein
MKFEPSPLFKSFIENDPILYALFFDGMRWGDVESF